MTWSDLAASGSGQLVIWLRIAGIEWVFGSADLTPHASDSWYWAAGPTARFSGVKPWLQWRGISIDEQASFIDGTLKVAGITANIVDTGAGMTALMSSWRMRSMTRLQADLDAAGGTMTVDSTTDFPASGHLWLGQEAVSYTGKTPTTFTGLARGAYGTRDSDHRYDAVADPLPIEPAVLDGPQSIGGRRANLYAATVEGGVVSESECIYRGYVGADLEPGEGIWPVKIDHITNLWSRKIMPRAEQTDVLCCYYYTGVAGYVSSVDIEEYDHAVDTSKHVFPTIPEGLYEGHRALELQLCERIIAETVAASFLRICNLVYDDTAERISWRVESCIPGVLCPVILTVREGDPFYALGFKPGVYNSGYPDLYQVEAQDEPRHALLEVPRSLSSASPAKLLVADSSRITADLHVAIADWPAVEVESSSGGVIELALGSFDRLRRGAGWYEIEEESDATMRHGFFTPECGHIRDFLRRALFLKPGQDEPEHWCVPLEAEDIVLSGGSSDELLQCILGAPIRLAGYTDMVTEPTAIDSIICDRLGLLGITPRLTTDARIGFTRISTPTAMRAESVELDEHMWEHTQAAQTRTLVEGAPLLNSVRVRHSYDYTKEKWAKKDASVLFEDGLNSRGKTFGKTYKCRGLHVSTPSHPCCYPSLRDLATEVAVRAVGAHLGLYARVAPVIPIPCVWVSRQLQVGDIVRISHPCIVDVAEGAVSAEDRIGVIVGRHLAVTDDEVDILYVQLPPEIRAGAIAPCALGTAWNQGARRLTFGATNLYSSSDLDEFEKTMLVGFTEIDSVVPNTWLGEISAVGPGWVDLTLDVFGATFAVDAPSGVWMHWRSYDASSAAQRLWLYLGDTGYTIGAAADEAYVWGL